MRSRPIGDGLEEHELVSPEFINAGSTWNFLLRVQVLEVAVTEPDEGQKDLNVQQCHWRICTHWSAPMSLPDLASPIYCSCLHHSLRPTRLRLRTVRASETMLDVEWKVSVWVSASYIPGRLLGALQMEMSPRIVAITYQVSTVHIALMVELSYTSTDTKYY